MEDSFFQTMKLTFELAGITTLILLFIGIPLGYFLSQTKSRLKPIIEALVSMPLVLPPSVLGFYLLLAFSPKNSFGSWLDETFDLRLVFSFEGLVIASVIFSLPFMVHPIQSGFSSLSKSLKEASFILGKSKLETLWYVLLPNIKPSLLTGIVISFAHTVGEFGVVLMIGGNIIGETKVASIAIYDEVEALNYDLANQYAFTLFIISFVILLFVYMINKKMLKSEFTK
ncbi:molybdate ABC transporter permease subunit [Arcobacter cloacae]|uniref:Molybdenum transport system permease n=1 Tax=Arcobacter cloacae TaxID=1054034 RepID=A0A4Q0ZEE6_9BACT|nr:molybdate ABC transporter permease subunit [Arcobacter cloacae]RXJ84773.1 molybdate ABC transporter permease subunit [Arcobacter cloacae]